MQVFVQKVLNSLPKAKTLSLATAISAMTLLPMTMKAEDKVDSFESRQKTEQVDNKKDKAKQSEKENDGLRPAQKVVLGLGCLWIGAWIGYGVRERIKTKKYESTMHASYYD